MFEDDIFVGSELRHLRVSVVTSRSKAFTPWRRANQSHFDMRKEVVKLKMKIFIFHSNMYDKYYIDIRETIPILTMGDLKRIALREVAKLNRPSYTIQPAADISEKLLVKVKKKNVLAMLQDLSTPNQAQTLHQ